MAHPVILGSVTTTLFNAETTSHNCSLGATWNAGDLILLVFGMATNVGHTANSASPPAEFSELSDPGTTQWEEPADFRTGIGVYAKIAEGDEDGTTVDVVTATATGGSSQVYRFQAGTWSGDLADIVLAKAMASDANADPPNLSPPGGAKDYMWIACGMADNDGIITGAPTNYTNLTETSSTATEDSSLGTARRELNASSENPGAFTQVEVENVTMVTIAIAPTSLPTLYPTSVEFNNGWTDEAGNTTDLHLLVDETGTPGTDYIRTDLDGCDIGFGFTDTPSDFGSMNSLQIEVRHSRGTVEGGSAASGNDTWELYAYITTADGLTALAGGNSTPANGQLINTSAVGYVPETDTVSFTYVNTTATKSDWDGGRLFIEGVFTASGGTDSHRVWVDTVRLVFGDYDLASEDGTVGQEGYRFRNDDGDEDAATWKAAQDVPLLLGLTQTAAPGGSGTFTPRRDENVTEDEMYIVTHIRPDNATHTGALLSRFNTSPNRSFYFMIRSDGAVLFGYSNDGSAVTDLEATVQWHSSAHSYPIEIGSAFWLAVSHDPNAATRETKFYAAPARELLPSHQLGTTVTFGSPGIVFDSNADYTINQRNDGGFHFEGTIFGVWLYASLDESGPELLALDFSSPTQGWKVGEGNATRRFDDANNSWMLDEDHVITGGVGVGSPFRLRTVLNAETNDPPTQAVTWKYKRVDEPDSEWRNV